MKSILLGLFLVSLFGAFTSIFALEPANLAIAKRTLVYYHDSGEYEQDIAKVVDQAISYVNQRIASHSYNGKKPAIVLDIDETAISNYPNLLKKDFGGSFEDNLQDRLKGEDETIKPVLRLYEFAKAHHIYVFFLTGRVPVEYQMTTFNLKRAGYHNWDGLILRTPALIKTPASIYKTMMRKQLTEAGYDILLTLGDQKSDLHGGFADKKFKLPNPFYLIP